MNHGWRLYTVRELQRSRETSPPLLATRLTLENREKALGIKVGQQFLLAPGGRPDNDVLSYLNSAFFRRLAEQTQRSYLMDLKVHLNFLFSQGKSWKETSGEDLLNYEFWRRRDQNNTRKISGSKFARELAALAKFYTWQVEQGKITQTPILKHEIRRRSGYVESASALMPKNIRATNVKWLTPRAYQRWRDIGLGGYGHNGLRDPTWRGRNDGRNVAFADTLWSSGLRLTEASTLLISELPQIYESECFYRGRLSGAVAKGGGGRDFWISSKALKGIDNYINIDRMIAVSNAQKQYRYEGIQGLLIIDKNNLGKGVSVVDENGVKKYLSLSDLNQRERTKLFIKTDEGLEPAQLWLTESGMPMPVATWEYIFKVANERCANQGAPIYCHPHMLRHSFALKMLVTLMHAFDLRMGLSPDERREFRLIFGDPWTLVQTMLGHSSSTTTRDIYLEPVNGLQIDLFLNGQSDDDASVGTLLSRIAQKNSRVKDV